MNIDCLLNRIAWNLLIHEYSVFRNLYQTESGEWTEDKSNAHLKPYVPESDDLEKQPWNKYFKSNIPNRPTGLKVKPCMCFTVKYDNYYQIGGKRFEMGEEEEAMIAAFFEYFKISIMDSFVKEHNRYMKHQKTIAKLLLTIGGEHGRNTC